ncbi:MAG: PQQ-binding-like beta-propeller repeat protein, partial [Planctomycetes bacterium]|nr:PQQ-binding-like beta-propeller repeat protein [Planctomycetota bacterium]
MNRSICWTLVVVLFGAATSIAGDWPQFRHDAQRTGATAESLPKRLHLQWVRQLATPQPAFPSENRLLYDGSYEPVVLGKTMFVPSMVTDSVTAVATATGKVKWRFFTDGPVRFAPVAWQDRLFFVSDDGHLYCVAAADGKLIWKFRGLPADRKDRFVVGNGRLISLRPARGGPVLKDGVIYFGAGIWLGDGIFLHALDAKTGKPRWSNTDSNLLKQANLDHGVKGYAGLAPQGYLAVLGEKLVVPCGAQLPGFLDRKTGKLEPYTMGWGGRVGLPKGSWLVAGTGKYLVHSGDLYDITRPNDERFGKRRGRADFKGRLYPGGYTRLMIDPANRRALGAYKQPVLTQDTLYLSDPKNGVEAYDLGKIEKKKRVGNPRKDRYPDKWNATLPRRWKLPSKLKIQIKAGNRLYLSGPGVIEAIELPQAGGKPTVAWRMKIQGTPTRMLAADGKLFVVTQEGRIYAFGENPVDKPVVHARLQEPSKAGKDRWTTTARNALKTSGVKSGYAIVLGLKSGRLAEELVRQSKLFVIAVDPNADLVRRLRQRFHRQGIYGTRITVHVGDPLRFPFPPYLANLVTSEQPALSGHSFNQRLARRIYYLLRPYGGTVVLSNQGIKPSAIVKEVIAAKLAGSLIRITETSVSITRSGPLPGAADWS